MLTTCTTESSVTWAHFIHCLSQNSALQHSPQSSYWNLHHCKRFCNTGCKVPQTSHACKIHISTVYNASQQVLTSTGIATEWLVIKPTIINTMILTAVWQLSLKQRLEHVHCTTVFVHVRRNSNHFHTAQPAVNVWPASTWLLIQWNIQHTTHTVTQRGSTHTQDVNINN